jgi:hypothetical protein
MMEVKTREIFPQYLIFKPKRTSKENKLKQDAMLVLLPSSFSIHMPMLFL